MSLGTAPRRLSARVWVTRSGRRLDAAGAAYWEDHFQRGLTDGQGHTVSGLQSKQQAARAAVAASDYYVKTHGRRLPPDEYAVATKFYRQARRSIKFANESVKEYNANLSAARRRLAQEQAHRAMRNQPKIEPASAPAKKPTLKTWIAARGGDKEALRQLELYQKHQQANRDAAQQRETAKTVYDPYLGQLTKGAYQTINPAAGALISSLVPRIDLELKHGKVGQGALDTALMLPFLRGPKALAIGARAAIDAEAGARLATGAEAAKTAFRESTPIRTALGATAGKLPVRRFRIGNAEVSIPASSSRTGRVLETMADRAARPVLSKVGVMKTEAERGMQEVGYSSRFRQTGQGINAEYLRYLGKKLNDKQEYALRILAEGISPAERAAEHLRLGSEATSKSSQLYHQIHADLNRKASQYIEMRPLSEEERAAFASERGIPVEKAPTELPRLRPDAPPRLKEAWDYFQRVGQDREQLLTDLGKITDERIAARVHGPARVFRGARYRTHEQQIQAALEANPTRQKIVRSLNDMVAEGKATEVQARAEIALFDAASRSMAQRLDVAPEELLNRIEDVRATHSDELTNRIEGLYQTVAQKAPDFNAFAAELAGHPGAPFMAQSAGRIALLMNDVLSMAVEGQAYRFWYTHSAEAILDHVGGDKEEAIKLAKLLAIYSPRARVWDETSWNNVTRALGAYDEFKRTGQVSAKWSLSKQADKESRLYAEAMGREPTKMKGRDWQTEAANAAMTGGEQWSGLKTNRFYRNFLEDIDPEAYAAEFGTEPAVTIDTWMRRAFGYPKTGEKGNETITPDMYDFMAKATTAIAHELGWSPKEAQAAIWTAIKAKAEGTPLDRAGFSFKEALERYSARPEQTTLFQEGAPKAASQAYRQNAGDDLRGLPTHVKYAGGELEVHSYAPAQALATAYMKIHGLPYNPPYIYAKVDVERAKRIADAYEAMPHDPTNPEVAAAYDAMIRETLAQYEAIVGQGVTFEFYPEGVDPYPNGPRDAMLDVIQNKHMYVFPTEAGFGTEHAINDHPLLGDSGLQWGGRKVTHNDVFRGVHDYFGHLKEGVGFRADGEENAWRAHSAMYSPQARRAMTVETRGQNSWVNYGPHGEANRTADQLSTVYADQKAGLLPEWVVTDGASDARQTRYPESVVHGGRHEAPVGRVIRPGDTLYQEDIGRPDMTPARPELPTVRRLPGETDEEFASRQAAVHQDYMIRKQAYSQSPRGIFEGAMGGDLQAFHEGLTNDVLGRAAELNAAGEAQGYLFAPGDVVRSKSSGREFTIVSKGFDQSRNEVKYRVMDNEGQQYDMPEHALEGNDTFPSEWAPQRAGRAQEFARPGGIKGAAEFTEAHQAIIHLTEQSDLTTLPHELAHVIRRFGLTQEEEAMIAKWAGATIKNKKERSAALAAGEKMPPPVYEWSREAEEKFAKGVEQFIRTGRDKGGIQNALRSLSPVFRDVYEHVDLPDLDPHVANLIARLFGFKKISGGSLVGADDVLPGVAYAPTWRGMPIRRLSQAHMAMGAYFRRGQELLAAGARRAVGAAGPQDQALLHTYKGDAILSGFFTPDVIGPLVERAMVANKMAAFKVVHGDLVKIGTELPQDVTDVAVRVEPFTGQKYEEQQTALKALWDKMASAEATGRKLDASSLEGVDFPLAEQMRLVVMPEEIEGKHVAEVAAEILDPLSGTQQPIDGIVWVNRHALEQTGLLYVPMASRLAKSGLNKQIKRAIRAGVLSYDAVNDFQKVMILYFNPAYIPVNLTGNLVMNAMHQGVFMPSNLWKAVFLHRAMGPLDKMTVDRAMGSGMTATMSMRTTPGEFAHATIGHWINQVVDAVPRRAAFLHEARRAGYGDPKKLSKILEGWRSGDEEASQTVEYIARKAKDAIVDYDRMSPMEREVITRIIFFYPWLRGATRYTNRFIVEHPYEAMGIAFAVDHMLATSDQKLGDRPFYAEMEVPISTESIGLSIPGTNIDVGLDQAVGKHTWTDAQGRPMVTNFRQALTMTTPAELIQSGIAFAGSYDPEAAGDLVSHLTPVPYALGVATYGYDPFKQKEVSPSLSAFFGQIGPSQTPLSSSWGLINMSPAERKKYMNKAINPRSEEQAWTHLFGGSLAPAAYNPEVGQERAAETLPTLERRRRKFTKQSQQAGYGTPPPQAQEDLEWMTRIDKQIKRGQSWAERYKIAASLYDERYGGRMETYIPSNELEAEQLYHQIRPLLYPAYAEWDGEVQKVLKAKQAAQPVGS